MTKSNDKREDDSVLKRLQEMQESFVVKEKEIKSIVSGSSNASKLKKKKKKEKNTIASDASYDNKKNNYSDSFLSDEKSKSKNDLSSDVSKKHKKKSSASKSALLKTPNEEEGSRNNSTITNKMSAENKNVGKATDNLEKKSKAKPNVKKTNISSTVSSPIASNVSLSNTNISSSAISSSTANSFNAGSSDINSDLSNYGNSDAVAARKSNKIQSSSYSDSEYSTSGYSDSSYVSSGSSVSSYGSGNTIANGLLPSGWIFQGSGNNLQFANEQLIALYSIESMLQDDINRIVNGFQKNDFLEKFFQKVAVGVILKKDVSVICNEALKKIYTLIDQYNVDKKSVDQVIDAISKNNGTWNAFDVSRALIDIGFNENPGVKKIHSAISAINEMMDDAYQKVTLFTIIDRTKKEVVGALDTILLRSKIDPSNNVVDKKIVDKYGFNLEQCNNYILSCLEGAINTNISTNDIISVSVNNLEVQKDGVLDQVNEAMNEFNEFDAGFGLSDKYTNVVNEGTIQKQIENYVNDKSSIDSSSVNTSSMTIDSLSKKKGLDLKK